MIAPTLSHSLLILDIIEIGSFWQRGQVVLLGTRAKICAVAGSYARRIMNMLQEPLPEMCYPLSARQLLNSQEGSKNKPRVSGWLSTHGNKGPAYVKATAAS